MNLNQIFTSLSTLKQEISVLTDATDINRHYVSLRELKQSLESIGASVDINQQRPCFAWTMSEMVKYRAALWSF